jgi:tetratricopeptide (TPR) repeat protein
MTDATTQNEVSLVTRLAAGGYWAARAARQLELGKYSEVVTICREHLDQEPHLISGRLAYGAALFHAGQTESAVEQFRRVLALDPDNIVALKYLGDVSWPGART